MQDIVTNDYPTTVKANLLIDYSFNDFFASSAQQSALLDEEGAGCELAVKELG